GDPAGPWDDRVGRGDGRRARGGDLSPRAAGPAHQGDEVSARGEDAVRAEVRTRPRRVDGGSGPGWGLPPDHERPEADGAGLVGGVQGPACDRAAVRAVEDGVR